MVTYKELWREFREITSSFIKAVSLVGSILSFVLAKPWIRTGANRLIGMDILTGILNTNEFWLSMGFII